MRCDDVTLRHHITLHLDVTLRCDVMTLRFLRYTMIIGLFFQNALVEYIGVCTDTNQLEVKSQNSVMLLWENGTRDG